MRKSHIPLLSPKTGGCSYAVRDDIVLGLLGRKKKTGRSLILHLQELSDMSDDLSRTGQQRGDIALLKIHRIRLELASPEFCPGTSFQSRTT